MSVQKLWYINSEEDEVVGPFPTKVIIERLILGRLEPDVLLSLDKEVWYPAKKIPEFENVKLSPIITKLENGEISWDEERRLAAKRWADERDAIDRRQEDSENDLSERRLSERRELEPNSIVHIRSLRKHYTQGTLRSFRRVFYVFFSIGIVFLSGFIFALWYGPDNRIAVSLNLAARSCEANASPKINWSGCNKSSLRLDHVNLASSNLNYARLSDAQLTAVNLSYATLQGALLSSAKIKYANLSGVNFRHAKLDNADLSGSDLRYADFRNAQMHGTILTDALLGNAIWFDGRKCAPSSRGKCE